MPTRLITRAVPVLAALALLGGCGGDESPTGPTTPPGAQQESATGPAETTVHPPDLRTISVLVAGGQVSPAPGPVDVAIGSTVIIEVTTDVADELHVHGYDRTAALAAGEPGRLELELTIPGQFEVELHGEHLLLFTLRVS